MTKTPKFENNIITKSDADNLTFKFGQSLQKLNQSSCYGLLIHHKEDIFKNGSEYLVQALNDLKFKGLVKKIGISILNNSSLQNLINSRETTQ